MNKKMIKRKNGFTFIELLIYVALIALLMGGAIIFLWDVVYLKDSTMEQNNLTYNELYTLGKGIYVSSNKNEVQDFMDAMYSPDIILTDRSTEDSFNIKLENSEIRSAWELDRPNLESRYLLIDLTAASLTSTGESLVRTHLGNSKDEFITISEIYLEWFNVSENINATEIIVNGNTVWSGSAPSGTTIDITDVVVPPDVTSELNRIDFDSNLHGGNIIMEMIMSDGSRVRGEFDLLTQSGEGGIAPTPCSEWCMERGYPYGLCKQNPSQCIQSGGEWGGEEGDVYCTGGPLEDTCCCIY